MRGWICEISRSEIGKNLAPLHSNCDCYTGILDEKGSIAAVIDKDGEIIDPKEIEEEFANVEKKEMEEWKEEFINSLSGIGIDYRLGFEILNEFERTDGKVPKEKFEEWGFADSFGRSYTELQYKLARHGMSVEGYDYQRSSERLDLAVSLAEIQAITAGIKLVTTAPPAVTDESDYDWHVEVERKNEPLNWDSWQNYEKVTENGRQYAKVGDRLYTRHAVNRMQPSGNRFGPNIYQGINGKDYGISISPKYVEDVINASPAIFQPETGNFIHTLGSVEVVVNDKGAVVTIMTYR